MSEHNHGLRGADDSRKTAASPWTPFHHPAFAVMWTAAVISNIGTWMSSAASSWLMTSLDADPLVVSLVQVAASLPMCLFAIPAGVLADIVDRRRFLLAAESTATVICALVALFVWLDLVTPTILLLFTFLVGASSALTAPAWQSVVPQLVPKDSLAPAVAANSVGVNISRAVGPTLGGFIITAFGISAPFWLNAASNLGIVAALLWWRAPTSPRQQLPAERFVAAVATGFRYASNNPHLIATLIRAVAFFLFASAYWALLPLVARSRIAGGPQLYGALLGSIGGGAVGGALVLRRLKSRFGPNALTAIGTLGTALALTLFGLAREPLIGVAASAIAGASWIAVLATLNVSAQVALPDWVRGRGLAMFVMVFFGAMTLGSAIWGEIAAMIGVPGAHFLAATGALLGIVLSWRCKLQDGAEVDLTPSMHWPTPVVSLEMQDDQGPVLVTVEYWIEATNRAAFLAAIEKLGHVRRRDGAYAWDIFEDAAEEGRYLETFQVESWLEHRRQHDRVTNADRTLQDAVDRFHMRGEPRVTHFVSALRKQ